MSALTSCFFEAYLTSKALPPDCGPSQSLQLRIYLYYQVSSLKRTLGFWTPFPWPPVAPGLTKGRQDDCGLVSLKQALKEPPGTSLAVQWLRFHASNAGAAGLIPGWGTKIPHAAWHGQIFKKRKKERKKEPPGLISRELGSSPSSTA